MLLLPYAIRLEKHIMRAPCTLCKSFFGVLLLALYLLLWNLKVLDVKNLQTFMLSSRDLLNPTSRKSATLKWLERRQAAHIRSYKKDVMVFAYMKGGSSILSQTFIANPNALFWFEPLDGYQTALHGQRYYDRVPKYINFQNTSVRPVPLWERELLAEFLHNLYSCDMKHLPPQLFSSPSIYCQGMHSSIKACINTETGQSRNKCDYLAQSCHGFVDVSRKNHCAESIHYFHKMFNMTWTNLTVKGEVQIKDSVHNVFKEHSKCFLKLRKAVDNCAGTLKQQCSMKTVHASKLLRLTMDSMKQILERMPGAYIIYYVRDPRAIVNSRKQHKMMSWPSIADESKALCNTMKHDIKHFFELKQKYPNTFILIRYEDFISNLNGTLHTMYGHFQQPLPSIVYTTLLGMMHSSAKPVASPKYVTRDNATELIDRWSKINSRKEIDIITNNCKDVLLALGYKVDA